MIQKSWDVFSGMFLDIIVEKAKYEDLDGDDMTNST